MRDTSEVSVELASRGTASAADDALIGRARRGDKVAFARLIEPRAAQLLRTARAMLRNESDAYEAAQEALIAAWVRLPALRDAGRFDAWLQRTLVNKCRDALRKRGRVREIELELIDVEAPDAIEAHISERAVLAAFDRLPLDERHILVLHHLHGLPLAEIASQLRIPIGTAKSRLWSARRHLEAALEAVR